MGKMTKIEIIDETVAYIKKNGRSVDELGYCMYRKEVPSGDIIGCAVGRCIIPEKYSEYFEGISALKLDTIAKTDLDNLLKKEYRGHSKDFWGDLQRLHDGVDHWTNDIMPKLTKEGFKYVEHLKQKYKL